MNELIVAIVGMILVVGTLAGWAVRADRRRRRQAALHEKEGVV